MLRVKKLLTPYSQVRRRKNHADATEKLSRILNGNCGAATRC